MHSGTILDKQAGQFIGFLQGAAAIVAQVYDDAFNTFVLQLLQQYFYVPCGAFVFLISPAHGVKIDVESRDIYHAYFDHFVAVGNFQYLLLGRLLLQLYLVADDGNDRLLIRSFGLGGYDLQANGGIFGATDQFNDLIEPPADNILHRAVFTLANGDDLV